MAYQPYKPARVFFDLETTANPEACALMPEPVVSAPSNYKDPEKIAEYIRVETANKKAEALDRAALDPDYGKILSIGLSIGKDITVVVNRDVYFPEPSDPEGKWEYSACAMSEVGMINLFWKTFADCNGHCVGYNILGFDLPYLLRRSMALEIPVPFQPNLAKFRTEPVTDLMMILYNWGSDKYKGLKQVAKLYGIPNDCPDIDGSKVSTISVEDLIGYQTSDVKLTMALYAKMNGVYFKH